MLEGECEAFTGRHRAAPHAWLRGCVPSTPSSNIHISCFSLDGKQGADTPFQKPKPGAPAPQRLSMLRASRSFPLNPTAPAKRPVHLSVPLFRYLGSLCKYVLLNFMGLRTRCCSRPLFEVCEFPLNGDTGLLDDKLTFHCTKGFCYL